MDIVTRRARRIRETLDLTLFEVARDTGIKPDRLSRFERSERLMRYDALNRLADYYSQHHRRLITIDELLEQETNSAKPKVPAA